MDLSLQSVMSTSIVDALPFLLQDIEDLRTNCSSKEEQVNLTYTSAVSYLDTANQLLSEAEQLSSTANEVPLQQLSGECCRTTSARIPKLCNVQVLNFTEVYFVTIDLLDEYVTETEALGELHVEAQRLQQELEDLTASFLEASERLRACYKTP